MTVMALILVISSANCCTSVISRKTATAPTTKSCSSRTGIRLVKTRRVPICCCWLSSGWPVANTICRREPGMTSTARCPSISMAPAPRIRWAAVLKIFIIPWRLTAIIASCVEFRINSISRSSGAHSGLMSTAHLCTIFLHLCN
ncbi:hypothetical protein SDC9_155712 [bioreactor metagenome]|uniref:Uncharacterized protein n=1 Tax=bioreactor metagenome TaxID=1076179 RepID=A0A645F3K9_9ZZZZ